MKHMSLIEHLRTLKQAIPNCDKPIANKPNTTSLPIFRSLNQVSKKVQLNKGIFQNLSFCIPLLDEPNDPSKQKVIQIIKGIFMQGGKIIQFQSKSIEQIVKFIIISQNSDLQYIKSKLKHIIRYEKIVKYSFITESLKKLKKVEYLDHLIYDNTQNLHNQIISNQQAVDKLKAEDINLTYIRPKIQISKEQMNQQKEQQIQTSFKHIYYQKQIPQIQVTKQLIQPQNIQITKNPQNTNIQVFKLPQFKIKNQSKVQQKFLKNTNYIKQQNKIQKTDKKQQSNCMKHQQLQKKQHSKKHRWFQPPKNLSGHSFTQNNKICDKLMELHYIYKRQNDLRQFIYTKAVAVIKSHNKQIHSLEDVKQIQGLSANMQQKIKQLLQTGSMSKLTKFKKSQENNICQELEKVHGIGVKKAKQLYDLGIKSIEQLKKRPQLINKSMAIGLKYFDQFSQRIPRQKVTRIFQFVKSIFFQLVRTQKLHSIQVVGSYRRNKPTCGDIDILICRNDGSNEAKLLNNFVLRLQQQGFITQSLTTPKLFTGKSPNNYMGVCFFQGQHHRIDIKHYPVDQYAFALMYFTGSQLFNRQMRMKAHNKGLMLSDHNLRKKQRNGRQFIYKGGKIPVMRTQQQIFNFLQMDYLSPEQRQI